MTSITDWLRSMTTTESDSTPDAESGAEGNVVARPEPTLFHCPTCDTVYVAVEKEDCGTCHGDVETLPSASA